MASEWKRDDFRKYLHEEVDRKVPFIVAGHGLKRRGVKDTRSLVSGLDVLPTLCDLAGYRRPPERAAGVCTRGMLRTRGYKYFVRPG